MKTLPCSPRIALALITAAALACTSSSSDPGSNTIGGDPNVPISQVGNQIDVGQLVVGTGSFDLADQVTVTQNVNGVATYHVNATIPNSPKVQTLLNLIPANIKDGTGKINSEFKLKVTTEGIQDYFNKDGAAFTLVKYDAKVGDVYTLTKSDGTKITRTVTQVSTTDDFPYGLLLIKTITVEQDSRIPGVSKIVMKINHKFGIVYAEFQMEDGSKIYSYLYSANT
jgi:hypothetical protein